MLHADVVIRADDRPLEQAPDALDAVRMNVSAHPFLYAVIDALVLRVLIGNTEIGGKLIGVDGFRVGSGVFGNEFVKHFLAGMLDDLKANLAPALHGSDGDSLVPLVSVAHTACLATNVGFVNLYNAPQKRTIGVPQRRTDAMAQMPSGLVGDAQRPLNLQGAHAFLALRHQVDGEEPFRQGQMGIVKDRAGRNRELIAAAIAVVLVAIKHGRDAFAFAARALDTFRPAKLSKTLAALFIAAKFLDQADKIEVQLDTGFSCTSLA